MGFLIRASCLWDGEAGWGARPVAVRVDGDRIARIERECAPLTADAVDGGARYVLRATRVVE